MKRLDKKAEPLALVHHCMAFKAVPVTTAGAHPEVVTGPVALAWDCFSGLTILSPGKFFEKLSHRCPFSFSILIIKSMLCAENSHSGRYQKENVNNS